MKPRKNNNNDIPSTSGFISFSMVSENGSSSPSVRARKPRNDYTKAYEQVYQGQNDQLRNILKAIGKKDINTKLNSLTQAVEVLKGIEQKSELALFVGPWCSSASAFTSVAYHNDRRIRFGAMEVMKTLISLGMRKTFQPYMYDLAGVWFLLMQDPAKEVAALAKDAWILLFGDGPKYFESLSTYINSIMQEMISNLAKTKEELSDMRSSTVEEAEERADRIHLCSLSSLSAIVEYSSPTELEKNTDNKEVMNIFEGTTTEILRTKSIFEHVVGPPHLAKGCLKIILSGMEFTPHLFSDDRVEYIFPSYVCKNGTAEVESPLPNDSPKKISRSISSPAARSSPSGHLCGCENCGKLLLPLLPNFIIEKVSQSVRFALSKASSSSGAASGSQTAKGAASSNFSNTAFAIIHPSIQVLLAIPRLFPHYLGLDSSDFTHFAASGGIASRIARLRLLNMLTLGATRSGVGEIPSYPRQDATVHPLLQRNLLPLMTEVAQTISQGGSAAAHGAVVFKEYSSFFSACPPRVLLPPRPGAPLTTVMVLSYVVSSIRSSDEAVCSAVADVLSTVVLNVARVAHPHDWIRSSSFPVSRGLDEDCTFNDSEAESEAEDGPGANKAPDASLSLRQASNSVLGSVLGMLMGLLSQSGYSLAASSADMASLSPHLPAAAGSGPTSISTPTGVVGSSPPVVPFSSPSSQNFPVFEVPSAVSSTHLSSLRKPYVPAPPVSLDELSVFPSLPATQVRQSLQSSIESGRRSVGRFLISNSSSSSSSNTGLVRPRPLVPLAPLSQQYSSVLNISTASLSSERRKSIPFYFLNLFYLHSFFNARNVLNDRAATSIAPTAHQKVASRVLYTLAAYLKSLYSPKMPLSSGAEDLSKIDFYDLRGVQRLVESYIHSRTSPPMRNVALADEDDEDSLPGQPRSVHGSLPQSVNASIDAEWLQTPRDHAPSVSDFFSASDAETTVLCGFLRLLLEAAYGLYVETFSEASKSLHETPTSEDAASAVVAIPARRKRDVSPSLFAISHAIALIRTISSLLPPSTDSEGSEIGQKLLGPLLLALAAHTLESAKAKALRLETALLDTVTTLALMRSLCAAVLYLRSCGLSDFWVSQLHIEVIRTLRYIVVNTSSSAAAPSTQASEFGDYMGLLQSLSVSPPGSSDAINSSLTGAGTTGAAVSTHPPPQKNSKVEIELSMFLLLAVTAPANLSFVELVGYAYRTYASILSRSSVADASSISHTWKIIVSMYMLLDFFDPVEVAGTKTARTGPSSLGYLYLSGQRQSSPSELPKELQEIVDSLLLASQNEEFAEFAENLLEQLALRRLIPGHSLSHKLSALLGLVRAGTLSSREIHVRVRGLARVMTAESAESQEFAELVAELWARAADARFALASLLSQEAEAALCPPVRAEDEEDENDTKLGEGPVLNSGIPPGSTSVNTVGGVPQTVQEEEEPEEENPSGTTRSSESHFPRESAENEESDSEDNTETPTPAGATPLEKQGLSRAQILHDNVAASAEAFLLAVQLVPASAAYKTLAEIRRHLKEVISTAIFGGVSPNFLNSNGSALTLFSVAARLARLALAVFAEPVLRLRAQALAHYEAQVQKIFERLEDSPDLESQLQVAAVAINEDFFHESSPVALLLSLSGGLHSLRPSTHSVEPVPVGDGLTVLLLAMHAAMQPGVQPSSFAAVDAAVPGLFGSSNTPRMGENPLLAVESLVGGQEAVRFQLRRYFAEKYPSLASSANVTSSTDYWTLLDRCGGALRASSLLLDAIFELLVSAMPASAAKVSTQSEASSARVGHSHPSVDLASPQISRFFGSSVLHFLADSRGQRGNNLNARAFLSAECALTPIMSAPFLMEALSPLGSFQPLSSASRPSSMFQAAAAPSELPPLLRPLAVLAATSLGAVALEAVDTATQALISHSRSPRDAASVLAVSLCPSFTSLDSTHLHLSVSPTAPASQFDDPVRRLGLTRVSLAVGRRLRWGAECGTESADSAEFAEFLGEWTALKLKTAPTAGSDPSPVGEFAQHPLPLLMHALGGLQLPLTTKLALGAPFSAQDKLHLLSLVDLPLTKSISGSFSDPDCDLSFGSDVLKQSFIISLLGRALSNAAAASALEMEFLPEGSSSFDLYDPVSNESLSTSLRRMATVVTPLLVINVSRNTVSLPLLSLANALMRCLCLLSTTHAGLSVARQLQMPLVHPDFRSAFQVSVISQARLVQGISPLETDVLQASAGQGAAEDTLSTASTDSGHRRAVSGRPNVSLGPQISIYTHVVPSAHPSDTSVDAIASETSTSAACGATDSPDAAEGREDVMEEEEDGPQANSRPVVASSSLLSLANPNSLQSSGSLNHLFAAAAAGPRLSGDSWMDLFERAALPGANAVETRVRVTSASSARVILSVVASLQHLHVIDSCLRAHVAVIIKDTVRARAVVMGARAAAHSKYKRALEARTARERKRARAQLKDEKRRRKARLLAEDATISAAVGRPVSHLVADDDSSLVLRPTSDSEDSNSVDTGSDSDSDVSSSDSDTNSSNSDTSSDSDTSSSDEEELVPFDESSYSFKPLPELFAYFSSSSDPKDTLFALPAPEVLSLQVIRLLSIVLQAGVSEQAVFRSSTIFALGLYESILVPASAPSGAVTSGAVASGAASPSLTSASGAEVPPSMDRSSSRLRDPLSPIDRCLSGSTASSYLALPVSSASNLEISPLFLLFATTIMGLPLQLLALPGRQSGSQNNPKGAGVEDTFLEPRRLLASRLLPLFSALPAAAEGLLSVMSAGLVSYMQLDSPSVHAFHSPLHALQAKVAQEQQLLLGTSASAGPSGNEEFAYNEEYSDQLSSYFLAHCIAAIRNELQQLFLLFSSDKGALSFALLSNPSIAQLKLHSRDAWPSPFAPPVSESTDSQPLMGKYLPLLQESVSTDPLEGLLGLLDLGVQRYSWTPALSLAPTAQFLVAEPLLLANAELAAEYLEEAHVSAAILDAFLGASIGLWVEAVQPAFEAAFSHIDQVLERTTSVTLDVRFRWDLLAKTLPPVDFQYIYTPEFVFGRGFDEAMGLDSGAKEELESNEDTESPHPFAENASFMSFAASLITSVGSQLASVLPGSAERERQQREADETAERERERLAAIEAKRERFVPYYTMHLSLPLSRADAMALSLAPLPPSSPPSPEMKEDGESGNEDEEVSEEEDSEEEEHLHADIDVLKNPHSRENTVRRGSLMFPALIRTYMAVSRPSTGRQVFSHQSSPVNTPAVSGNVEECEDGFLGAALAELCGLGGSGASSLEVFVNAVVNHGCARNGLPDLSLKQMDHYAQSAAAANTATVGSPLPVTSPQKERRQPKEKTGLRSAGAGSSTSQSNQLNRLLHGRAVGLVDVLALPPQLVQRSALAAALAAQSHALSALTHTAAALLASRLSQCCPPRFDSSALSAFLASYDCFTMPPLRHKLSSADNEEEELEEVLVSGANISRTIEALLHLSLGICHGSTTKRPALAATTVAGDSSELPQLLRLDRDEASTLHILSLPQIPSINELYSSKQPLPIVAALRLPLLLLPRLVVSMPSLLVSVHTSLPPSLRAEAVDLFVETLTPLTFRTITAVFSSQGAKETLPSAAEPPKAPTAAPTSNNSAGKSEYGAASYARFKFPLETGSARSGVVFIYSLPVLSTDGSTATLGQAVTTDPSGINSVDGGLVVNTCKDAFSLCSRHLSKSSRGISGYLAIQNLDIVAKAFSISVNKNNREILASYEHVTEEGPIRLGVILKYPQEFPLRPVSVVSESRVGVDEAKWRSIETSLTRLLQGQTYNGLFSNLDESNDPNKRDLDYASHGDAMDVASALVVFKKSLDRELFNADACPICYCHLNAKKQLPRQACMHCKKKFHSDCISRWFLQSREQERICPLCRQKFKN